MDVYDLFLRFLHSFSFATCESFFHVFNYLGFACLCQTHLTNKENHNRDHSDAADICS